MQSVAYRTKDVLLAFEQCTQNTVTQLRIDGGMAMNNWLAQFLADILNANVQRPKITETSALGVAYLAGLQVGVFESLAHIEQLWQDEREFHPKMEAKQRDAFYHNWCNVLTKVVD